MDKHYYLAINSNRIITSNGLDFTFDPVTMEAGVWIGVFATDVEEQVVALNALVEKPNESGVYPLTAEQYDEKIKKKAQSLLDYKTLSNAPTRSQAVRAAANPAEESESSPDAEVRESKEVSREEVDNLFAPTQVKEPESPPTPTKKRRRRKSQQPESTEA